MHKTDDKYHVTLASTITITYYAKTNLEIIYDIK